MLDRGPSVDIHSRGIEVAAAHRVSLIDAQLKAALAGLERRPHTCGGDGVHGEWRRGATQGR
jgi:hypothetical protein